MYNLVDPITRVQVEQSYQLVDLFKKLDGYTAKRRMIVITNENGVVVAGNVIAFEYAGKAL